MSSGRPTVNNLRRTPADINTLVRLLKERPLMRTAGC
jgi:hypothetical protein